MIKGRAFHHALAQKSRLAASSSDGDEEDLLLRTSLEVVGDPSQCMARSSTSSRSGTSRAVAAGILVGGAGATSSLSKSKRRWGCPCSNKGRCVNSFLVLSLLLSVSSLLISSISLASMFPVAGQITFADKLVYSPCRIFMVGMRSAAMSGWSSRCADFFLSLSSQFKRSARLEKSVEIGHFYLQKPPDRSGNGDVVAKSYVTSFSRGALEAEDQSLYSKPVVSSEESKPLHSSFKDGDGSAHKETGFSKVKSSARISYAGSDNKLRLEGSPGTGSFSSTPMVVDDTTEYELNSPSVPAAIPDRKHKDRLSGRKLNATRIRPEGRILSDHTITSLYSVRNDFGYRVNYYVFHTLCFNSTHVLHVGPETCLQGWDAAADSDLTAVACDDTTYEPRRKLLRETHLEEASTSFEWLQQRNVTWWNGTSTLIHLDRSCPNVAHFIGKVNGMLAFNNLSVPLFTDHVDRVLILKHDNLWKPFRWRAENFEGFLPVYLADTLSRLLNKRIVPKHLLGNQLFAADGKVQIGMEWDELIASDHHPICFEKVVIPGVFKGSQYPGRLVTANRVRKNLVDLYLSAEQKTAIRDRELQKTSPVLLYIVRNGKRRTFFPESEQAFQKILPKTGFDYRIVDFNEMTFREQFATVQTADISIALHGANLMNPSMFSRERSILVEVIPFNVLHRMYEAQALDIGLIYLGHQCLQGTVQQGDQKFSRYRLMECMQHAECKERFLQQRKIELTARDLTELEQVVSFARELVIQIDRRRLRDKLGSSELLEVVEGMVGKGSCQRWSTGTKDMCRGNWVSFMDHQGYYICYINYFCDAGEDKSSVV